MNEHLKVTLLGTGSPRPTLARSRPSQIVHVGEEMFLVDCGDGTSIQLLRAKIDPGAIRKVIFTHLHADHTLGYAQFVLGGWSAGREKLRVWGPRGVAHLTDVLFKDLYREDIEYRISIGQSIGRSSAGLWDIETTELEPGPVLDTGVLKITACQVIHSISTLAYRFDFGEESLVISGDTAYCSSLVELSRRADVLVQDCTVAPLDGSVSEEEASIRLNNLHQHHTSAREAGRIAREAGVRRLVLTHFLPNADLGSAARECRMEFDGEIIMGEDLMVVSCRDG